MSKTALRHPARLAGSSFLRLQSDERLAELAAAGHDAAFDAIVVRHRAALLRYCGAIAGSSRAEDAVQQTLLNAHAALGDAAGVRHVRSWLYRIAHNVSLNLLRGVRDDVSLNAEGVRLPPAPSSSESFEGSERFRATMAALQALPERQRAALVLRELEGRSHEEIADALGVSAGSARQHLMRARVAMRGAVTAVTPWGLIVRIAELASSSGGAPGGLETGAGAGLGAGLAKLTAGAMATGALVGSAAVGTHEVVRHDTAAPARADTIHTNKPRHPATAPAAVVTTHTTAVHREDTGRDRRHDDHGNHRGHDDAATEHTSDTHRRSHDDHSKSGRGGDGGKESAASNPNSGSGSSGPGSNGSGSSSSGRHGSGSGSLGTSGSGSSGSSGSGSSGSGSSGSSGSGRHGSGSSGSSGSGSSGSGSSGSASSGSGSSGSGSSGSGSSGTSGSESSGSASSNSGPSGSGGSGKSDDGSTESGSDD